MTIPAPEMTELRAMLTKVHDLIANTVFADDESRDVAVNLDNDILATLGAHPIGDTLAAATPSLAAQYAADCEEFAADQSRENLTEMPVSYWNEMAAEWRRAEARLAASERERDEARGQLTQIDTERANWKRWTEASEAKELALTTAAGPLVDWLTKLEAEFSKTDDNVIAGGIRGISITFGDLRRLRAVLEQATPYDPTTQPFDEPFRHEQAITPKEDTNAGR